ncbi:MAG: energy transducer TonB [Bacteroidetes bacterium]|nr:energy transducer TonB [Bacteroidota bacterium]HET6243210.1 energy transducer TonB [Bacteroidia bacterium]
MELKKNSQVDLEKKKPMFLKIGLVISISLVLMALEWKSYEGNSSGLGELLINHAEEEMIPITIPEIPLPPAPPVIIELVLVDNEIAIEKQVEINSTESDQTTYVEIIPEVESIDEVEFFRIVEEMPSFPGCESIVDFDQRKMCTDEKIQQFLFKNTKYPQMSFDAGITGTVYVSFTIGPDGKTKNISIARGVKGLDDEAIRVIESFPVFSPGKQRGKPVTVAYTLPFKFSRR